MFRLRSSMESTSLRSGPLLRKRIEWILRRLGRCIEGLHGKNRMGSDTWFENWDSMTA